MGITKKTYREFIIGKLSDFLSSEVAVKLANNIIDFGEEHGLLDKNPLKHHLVIEEGKIVSSYFEEVSELDVSKLNYLKTRYAYPRPEWQYGGVFHPIHQGSVPSPNPIPDYAVTEPDDVVLLKQRIDDFVDKINPKNYPDELYLGPKYFSAIKEHIVQGKYRGLEVMSDERQPKNLIYAKSKYHK